MKSKRLRDWVITLPCLIMITACDRSSKDETRSNTFEDNQQLTAPPQTSATVPSPQLPVESESKLDIEKEELNIKLRDISGSAYKEGEFTEGGLEQLEALIPRLKSAGMLWYALRILMPHQIERFRDIILSSLHDLSYDDSGFYSNSGIQDAYLVAEKLEDPEVAKIALEQLALVKPYQYPKGILPTRSPNSLEAGEHLFRGQQGILAANIVKWGDESTMNEFRKILSAAPPESQRVLIWAMGRSPRLEDFEFLIELRKRTNSPEILDTLVRAINRIPREMNALAKYPTSVSVRYRPKDPQMLLEISENCRNRLVEKNLTIELSIYD